MALRTMRAGHAVGLPFITNPARPVGVLEGQGQARGANLIHVGNRAHRGAVYAGALRVQRVAGSRETPTPHLAVVHQLFGGRFRTGGALWLQVRGC